MAALFVATGPQIGERARVGKEGGGEVGEAAAEDEVRFATAAGIDGGREHNDSTA